MNHAALHLPSPLAARRALAAISLVAFVAAALAGCGSDSDGGCAAGEILCAASGPTVCCPQDEPFFCPSTGACAKTQAAASKGCPGPVTFNGKPDNGVACSSPSE
ncbi:MAG TPA: hypothetical protein VGM56_11535 [Byssovorax sp.]|jgi:hypothetical protein